MDAITLIETEEASRLPSRIQMPIPRLRSAFEARLPVANPQGDLLAQYEAPLPLHRLSIMELRQLEVNMRHLLDAFAELRVKRRLESVPGWVSLLTTEYGFVHAALQTIPFDESDALPPP